ncbi:MAG TPA: tetratricopeptide repeat protein, partial [Caulobacteraceae bacterium]
MSSPLRAKASTSAAALQTSGFGRADPAPSTPEGIVGEAGSQQALDRLGAALSELKLLAARPYLQQAIRALQAEQPQAAAEAALKALEHDERCGHAWWLLGIARDKAGDLTGALQCYEAAIQLLPEQDELANDLGRLAFRLGLKPMAEALFAKFLAAHPDSVDAANNLACALRDQFRHDEAIEILRGAIHDHPGDAMLWNTLGTVLSEQGEFETASTFFGEALRCDESMFRARYNRGNAKLALGDAPGALVDCETALGQVQLAEERAMMLVARSTLLLNLGRIGEGWDAYEARFDPAFGDVTHFLIDRPRWTPQDDLAGRTLLVMGEQGLGDEVLFANLLPDVLKALGPDGQLLLAVEQRLVPLFQRSLPTATVGPHATRTIDARAYRGAPFVADPEAIDLWTPFGSLLRRFRRSVEAYPDRRAFLTPDQGRVRHWRGVLDALGPGPKVGLLWKSLKIETARARFYSPFEAWTPVLNTPGAVFVNLQYGDCTAEIAAARAQLGVEIFQPPQIDLKDHLDDVAALCCALDLIVGPANATSNIAAACGAATWMISTPGAWPKLGTRRLPWYPSMRVFEPPGFNQWAAVMADVAQAL